jgi:hypothetical protein
LDYRSRVSHELDALASDVLHFLRGIEAAVITACEGHKRELLFVAWRVMKRAGEASEVAKEGTLDDEAALERITSMRREITQAARMAYSSTVRFESFDMIKSRRDPQGWFRPRPRRK